jgi:hypothetical protein
VSRPRTTVSDDDDDDNTNRGAGDMVRPASLCGVSFRDLTCLFPPQKPPLVRSKRRRDDESDSDDTERAELANKTAAPIEDVRERQSRRTRRRAAVRKAKAAADRVRMARAAARATVAQHGANPVRPSAHEIEDFEHNPTSAQLMFAQMSGFDINHQAFDDRPELEPITRHAVSERMNAYHEAMGPMTAVTSCASCGMVVIGSPCHIVELETLHALRLSDEQRGRHDALPADARRLRNVVEHGDHLCFED